MVCESSWISTFAGMGVPAGKGKSVQVQGLLGKLSMCMLFIYVCFSLSLLLALTLRIHHSPLRRATYGKPGNFTAGEAEAPRPKQPVHW